MATTFSDAITFQNAVAFRGGATGLSRSSLAQDDLKHYPIIPTAWRVWNAYDTILPGTSAADDLGLYAGAFATGCPYVGTGDVKTLTTTRYARTTFQLPPEYVAGARVQIRAHGGMVTTTAGTSSKARATASWWPSPTRPPRSSCSQNECSAVPRLAPAPPPARSIACSAALLSAPLSTSGSSAAAMATRSGRSATP